MNTVPSSDEGLIKIIRRPEETEAIDRDIDRRVRPDQRPMA